MRPCTAGADKRALRRRARARACACLVAQLVALKVAHWSPIAIPVHQLELRLLIPANTRRIRSQVRGKSGAASACHMSSPHVCMRGSSPHAHAPTPRAWPLPAASIRCRSHQSPCCASNTWRKYSAFHTACARGCRHSRRRLPAREKAARFPAPHIGHLRRSPWQSSRQMHAHACGGGADTRAQEAEAEARTSWVPLRPWPRQRRRASSSTIGMSTIGALLSRTTLKKK